MNFNIPNLSNNEQALNSIREKQKRDEEYKEEVLDTLKQIESNTANLSTLVELIQDSNEQQEEIINIITELLSISKERDKSSAESKYRKTMKRISEYAGDIKAINILYGFANTLYPILKANNIL